MALDLLAASALAGLVVLLLVLDARIVRRRLRTRSDDRAGLATLADDGEPPEDAERQP